MGRQARLKKARRELPDHDQAVDQLAREQRTDAGDELHTADHDQAVAFFSNGRGRTGIITSSGDVQYCLLYTSPSPRDS